MRIKQFSYPSSEMTDQQMEISLFNKVKRNQNDFPVAYPDDLPPYPYLPYLVEREIFFIQRLLKTEKDKDVLASLGKRLQDLKTLQSSSKSTETHK